MGGFTLVEMMVSLSIIFVISAIALTSQSTFNQTILLNDTSYTVALSARQAQSLGLSSRKFGTTQNGGYGIHFTAGTPNTYTLFADVQNVTSAPLRCPTLTVTGTPEEKAGNCLYDGVGETYQSYTLNRGFTISDFCGKTAGGMVCASTNAIQGMDIVFLRPNTVAIITGLTGSPGSKIDFSCAQITVKSPTGAAVQTVRISELGEVSVGQVCQ